MSVYKTLFFQRMEEQQRQSFEKDSVKSRRLDEAFEPYRKPFILGDLRAQKMIINEFVSSLLSAESSRLAEERAVVSSIQDEDASLEEILTCTFCHQLFHDPVTLVCGHTFCLECLESFRNQTATVCPGCRQPSSLRYMSNIVVRELSRIWFARQTQVRYSIAEAKRLLSERTLVESMTMVNSLLARYPENVDVLCLRAHGYRSVKCNREALDDLDLAYRLAPFNSKVLYARGELLASLDQPEEAMAMFLRASALEPGDTKYYCSLIQYVEKLLRNNCDAQASQSTEHETTKRIEKKLPKPKATSDETSTRTSRQMVVCPEPQNVATRPTPVKNNLELNSDECLDELETLSCQTEVKSSEVFEPSIDTRQSKSNIPSELECKLCFNLIFEPVTTPCGHSLCRSCLRRCLDHRFECPCCRTNLQSYLEYLMLGCIGTCEVLEKILLLKFKDDYELRKFGYEKELEDFSRYRKV